MRAVTRPLERSSSTSTTSPAATASCSCATVSASPAAASPRGCRTTMPPRLLAVDRARRRDGGGAGGPVAIGVLPFLPGAPAELVDPERRRAQDVPTGRAWVTADRRRRASRLARTPARPAAASYDIRPAVDVDHYLARGRGGARRGACGRHRQGRDRPRDRRQVRPADRRPRRAAPAARPASGRATATRSTGSSARRPSCSSRSTATSSGRIRSPARRRAPVTRARRRARRRS